MPGYFKPELVNIFAQAHSLLDSRVSIHILANEVVSYKMVNDRDRLLMTGA